MANLFQSITLRKPKRTAFDLSYSNKLSVDFGRLTPMLMEKTVPGDKFYVSDEFLCRFAPFFGQVFQAMKLRTEYFFVPSRILWNRFEMFLANGINGTSSYVHPYIDMKLVWSYCEDEAVTLQNSLFDFFNISTDNVDYTAIGDDFHIDALPFYAYCKAFIDYYADENLDYLPLIQMFEGGLEYATDGDNTNRVLNLLKYLHNPAYFNSFDSFINHYNAGHYTPNVAIDVVISPLVRSYPKDYFTSALPFAQRGPIVQIPLNGEGDVKVFSKGISSSYDSYRGVGVKSPASSGSNVEVTLYEYGTPNLVPLTDHPLGYDVYGGVMSSADLDPSGAKNAVQGPNTDNPSITFKAVNINGTATITDLRTAFAVQNWLEKRARAGSRAKEQIYASFGVKSKDYRLDRAEFISAFSSTVKIGEVFTTAQNDDGSFVPGLGVSVGQLADKSRRWKKSMPEHGYCFGLVSLYPVATYFQGVPRQFLELDIMDYFWPEFQHIGEQPIYNCELKIDDESNNNFGVFGYTPRYAHYKTRTDQIHGDFRSSLEYMVAARKFNSVPTLCNDFVQFRPAANDLYRIFNATAEWVDANPCYIDIFHHFKAVRPMSYFGNPRLI